MSHLLAQAASCEMHQVGADAVQAEKCHHSVQLVHYLRLCINSWAADQTNNQHLCPCLGTMRRECQT